MARPARNFSRTAIAVAATCILGATATLPAIAAEEDEATSFAVDVTTSAVAEAQPSESASAMASAVPEEPGNDTTDSSGEPEAAEAAGSADAAGGTEAPNESESAADGDGGDGSDNGNSDASDANNEAEAGVDGGDSGAGSEGSTSDDDADSDGSGGEEPGETEEPQESVTPPVTNPEPALPVVPVEPKPENSGPVMVPEEPGKVDKPGAPRSSEEQSGSPTLNASISPEEDPADEPSATTDTEALSQTGANELLIVLGIGALLVIGGLVLVVLRLRKRGE